MVGRNIAALTFSLLTLISFSSTVRASSEFVPIQERAQGQALTGALLLNDSIYSNPSASVFTRAYNVEGTYQAPRTFAVSVLDTQTSDIGGGLGYFRKAIDNSDQALQGLRLALGTRVSEQFAVGVGGKAVWGPGWDGVATKMNDLDLGMLGNFGIAQVGFTLRNVLGGNDAFGQPREWAAGVRVGWEQLIFASLTAMNRWGTFGPYQYGLGVEYVSPYYFSIKGGYRITTDTRQSFWSAGASLLAPNCSIHYAVEFAPTPDKPMEHILAASLMF